MTDKNIQYSHLLDEQIGRYGKETKWLEFKSNYQTAEKLGQYISALSNGACLEGEEFGYLYFGVDDETLAVKGTTFDCSREKAKGEQALEDHGKLSRPEIDALLMPNLSDQLDETQKKTKVRHLLSKWKEKGLIVNERKSNESIWTLALDEN